MQISANDEFPELNQRLISIYQTLNGDLTPLTSAIGALIEGSTRDRFRTKTDPKGDPWAELMPSTKEYKHGSGGVLVEYGDLMRSITYHASSASVAIGTDRPYGKYHQTGTKNADGSERMAARIFLGISESDKSAINEILDDFISEAVNGQ